MKVFLLARDAPKQVEFNCIVDVIMPIYGVYQ